MFIGRKSRRFFGFDLQKSLPRTSAKMEEMTGDLKRRQSFEQSLQRKTSMKQNNKHK
jgi:hypothetical protein